MVEFERPKAGIQLGDEHYDKWELDEDGGIPKGVRRSGVSIFLLSFFLRWAPDVIYQIGVGELADEVRWFHYAWPKVRLIGYEPCAQTAKTLRETGTRDMKKPYPGALIEAAVSNYVGSGFLNVKPRHKAGSSLMSFGEGIEHVKQPCRITTLDHEYPDGPEGEQVLLWIDAEGAEMLVLEGGTHFVENVQVINVETTSRPYGPGWCMSTELHHELIRLGFIRQWLHSQRAAAGQSDAIYVRRDLFRPEFCCCPCSIDLAKGE